MGIEGPGKKGISRRELLKQGVALTSAAFVSEPVVAEAARDAQLNDAGMQAESIPRAESVSEADVRLIFTELLGDNASTDIRRLEDGNGLYLLEVKVIEPDGYSEYTYTRGRPEKGQKNYWVIDKTMYDEKGDVVSGYPVAKRKEGTWSFIA